MKVLVACEESGRVRDAFLERGHDAWSCDLLPSSSKRKGRHIQGDVLAHLYGQTGGNQYDLMIAHPPCTYLCNSGVRWLYEKKDLAGDGRYFARVKNTARWEQMHDAVDFFMALLDAPIPNVAVENPIPHGHATLPEYTQIIQPWMFGDNFTKATCLWLRGLPQLIPDTNQKPEQVEAYCHRLPPGPDRARLRSQTYLGIARAMAEQWG